MREIPVFIFSEDPLCPEEVTSIQEVERLGYLMDSLYAEGGNRSFPSHGLRPSSAFSVAFHASMPRIPGEIAIVRSRTGILLLTLHY